MKIEQKNLEDIVVDSLDLPGTNAFSINIHTPVGSHIEKDYEKLYGKKIYGGLHLLEHMCFKSPFGYDTNELLEKFRERGVRNAGTTFESIFFYFDTTMDHIEFGIDSIIKLA